MRKQTKAERKAERKEMWISGSGKTVKVEIKWTVINQFGTEVFAERMLLPYMFESVRRCIKNGNREEARRILRENIRNTIKALPKLP